MPGVTKKPHTDDGKVSITLRVHRNNASLIREYARAIESEEKRNYSLDEVFPECVGREQQVALRAYRTREGITQKQLAQMTEIPQRHISEMENGKRGIGKERARKLAEALHVSDYRFFL